MRHDDEHHRCIKHSVSVVFIGICTCGLELGLLSCLAIWVLCKINLHHCLQFSWCLHHHCGSVSPGFPRSALLPKKEEKEHPSRNPLKGACSSRFDGRPGHARWQKWPTNYLRKHRGIWGALVASNSASPHVYMYMCTALMGSGARSSTAETLLLGGSPRNTFSAD